jgi:hypothetical protein
MLLGASAGSLPAGPPEAPALAAGLSDEEFIGPLAGWLDARSDFGALGDGVHDDTAALQRGLDRLRSYDAHTGPAVLYLPAGTYRITRQLRMRLKTGANVIGAGAEATTIAWDGPADGTMLLTSGAFDTLFSRLTWDGRKRARTAVAQWWNFRTDRANYQGSIKHIDESFHDLAIGIQGGRLGRDYGQGDSETLIQRVRFSSISQAAVDLGSYNALNWWIWDSQFIDCARGVSNEFSVDDRGPATGAGTFMLYRNLFRRSTVADVAIANTGWFSLSANVSIASRRFLQAAPMGANGGPVLLQDNSVFDTAEPAAVEFGNEGPLILLDNLFASRAESQGPTVRMIGSGTRGDRDVLSLGNRFTAERSVAFEETSGRWLAQGDRTVARAGLEPILPPLPGPAPDLHRRVFEVPAGASADRIQAAIDAAAASGAPNAVVHLPAGDYHLSRTLVVPANSRLQLAGDSETTQLYWQGRDPHGPLLRLEGPSFATVRDVCLLGQQATAIEIDKADQPGGRIFVEGSRLAQVRLSGLAATRVDFQSNSGVDGLLVDASRSVLGIAGFGPLRISGDSRVLESDNWYEGDRAEIFTGKSGEFTYLGGEIAPYSHGVGAGRDPDQPAIALDGFAGHAAFIGGTMVLPRASNGIRLQAPGAGAVVLLFGMTGTQPNYLDNSPDDAGLGFVFAKTYARETGALDLPDRGRSDIGFIAEGFRQARAIVWETVPFAHTDGATDVRLLRVFTDNSAVGLQAAR